MNNQDKLANKALLSALREQLTFASTRLSQVQERIRYAEALIKANQEDLVGHLEYQVAYTQVKEDLTRKIEELVKLC